MTTREQIQAAYENLHRITLVRDMLPISEVRSDWYVFLYGQGEGLFKPTGQVGYMPTIVLFPTMGKAGITGELFWYRCSNGGFYTGGKEGALAAELAILERHEE
jgi:hypothetical protein